MLVLAKFFSDQPGAKDDISRMLDAGIVNRAEAVRILSLMNKKDAADLVKLFKEMAVPRKPRPRPKKR